MKTTKTIALATALLFAWQGVWAEDLPHFKVVEGDNGKVEDGSEEKPFLIDSVEELNYMAEDINNGFNYDKCFLLVTDLVFNGENFTPIGCEGNDDLSYDDDFPFSGFFDGNDKTIKGITVNKPNGFNIALFGYISGATITNLTLDECTFIGNSSVGGIVGYTDNTGNTIENCHVTSKVTITGSENSFMVGGIVGCDQAGKITNCTSAAKVSGHEAVGGIVGYATESTLENCTSSASLIGNSAVGGIAGNTETTVSDQGNVTTYQYVTLTDCFYTGSTIPEGEDKGAIIGARGGYNSNENYELIFIEGSDICIINITLLDDDTNAEIKNETRLSNYSQQTCDVTISGRTLYSDGWNTLCLPFVVDITGTDLNGASLKTLSDDTDFNDGTLTLNFSDDLTSISTNKPFIVKPNSDVENPVFKGVTIAPQEEEVKVETTYIDFVGNYDPFTLAAGNTTLYLGANNTLYYPSTDVTINSFRAHFELKNDLTAGEPTEPGQQPIKAFNLNFGDEETGIREISTPSNSSNSSNLWFTLDGRRLNGQPTQSGIFIHGGKKVFLP